jgi:hypothetical protein
MFGDNAEWYMTEPFMKRRALTATDDDKMVPLVSRKAL